MAKKKVTVDALIDSLEEIEKWLGMVRKGLEAKKGDVIEVDTTKLSRGSGMTRRVC